MQRIRKAEITVKSAEKTKKESGETNNRLLTAVQTWRSSERAGANDCDALKIETL